MNESCRKRNRDPFGPRADEHLYKEITQTVIFAEVYLFICPRLLKHMRGLKKFKARKMAIYYQFLLYGAPEEEQ